MVSVEPSPFHHGEQEIQSRFGVREQIENVGQRFIRDHLPDDHRQFYPQLPLLPFATWIIFFQIFSHTSKPRIV